jgi:hypothetical protein
LQAMALDARNGYRVCVSVAQIGDRAKITRLASSFWK